MTTSELSVRLPSDDSHHSVEIAANHVNRAAAAREKKKELSAAPTATTMPETTEQAVAAARVGCGDLDREGENNEEEGPPALAVGTTWHRLSCAVCRVPWRLPHTAYCIPHASHG